ncbi:hypothetical protein AMTRI_Chr12g273610 [Amborella trichopoda]
MAGREGSQAVGALFNLFTKAKNDLNVVQNRLQKEFEQAYPDNANPMRLLLRIKKLNEELPSLKEQCGELLAAKQDLIDKTRMTLVGNKKLIQRMQASSGIHVVNSADDTDYAQLNQIIDEWNAQVGLKTGDEKHVSSSNNLNQLLFSAKVQNI